MDAKRRVLLRKAGVALLAGALPAPGDSPPAAASLPEPRGNGAVSVEKALGQRRSVRQFADAPLELSEVAQLLWAAQGQNRPGGGRTAPSAGALYPLEIYLVAGRVDGLAAGVYVYASASHDLVKVAAGDRRSELSAAALAQDWLRRAPAMLVIAAAESRTARRYGGRATRYVDFEAGCAAQNVALQAVAAGLGTVVVGAFDDAAVSRLVGLKAGERPIVVMPVGR